MAIAAVHEHLHQPEAIGRVHLASYLTGILSSVNSSFGNAIRLDTEMENVHSDPDIATTLGLIVNELISNANKYAYPDRPPGTIWMRLRHDGEQRGLLTIRNDGIPFDANVSSNGIGIRLIRGLATQVNPDFTFDGSDGLDFRITFAALN